MSSNLTYQTWLNQKGASLGANDQFARNAPLPGPNMEGSKPTNTRYWVIASAATLAVITYIHRVAISQAAPFIIEELNLSKVEMGWVFASFALSYSLFQVPGGWMSDWKGPRRVLTTIVLWWSLFTAATGWAWNLGSLLMMRFLFGAGQGGGFPVLTKTFTTWLHPRERVRAQGLMWLAARWGGAFTPLLIVYLLQFFSWRQAFELIAVLGIVWAALFWRWYRDNPREHPDVNVAEMAILQASAETASGHGDVPWKRFFRSRTVWLLWIQYFCIGYGTYFYITWLPTYLQEDRGQSMEQSALLSVLPLFMAGLGSLFSGFIVRPIERWIGSRVKSRRYIASLGFTLAGILLAFSVSLNEPIWALVIIGISSFASDFVMPTSWSACMDVGGKYAGSLSGSMNTAGNIAGFVAPATVAYILLWSNQNWALTFYISCGVYFAGAICWLFIDPVSPLDREEPSH